MSKNDYIGIAKIINDITHCGEIIYKEDLINSLITLFKEDNPLFNPEKFKQACDN